MMTSFVASRIRLADGSDRQNDSMLAHNRRTMGARRNRINFSEEEFDMIDRAAYWEGFENPTAFVVAVTRKYIERRQVDRGTLYGKARWAAKGSGVEHSEENAED